MTNNILLADDELTFRDTFAAVLCEEGLNVTTVSNGIDALEAVNNHPYTSLFSAQGTSSGTRQPTNFARRSAHGRHPDLCRKRAEFSFKSLWISLVRSRTLITKAAAAPILVSR